MNTATPTQGVSLSDYWQMLKDHDWKYEHNEDPQAWHQAHAERHRLVEITKQSRDHDVLYSVILAWSLGRCPLPPQPAPSGHSMLLAAEDDARKGGEL